MNNISKNKSGFTIEDYRSMLLSFIDEGYDFAFFESAIELLENAEQFVLLRHDLDLSITRALPLALVESDLGVKSTFFIRLRNGFYNPFNFEESKVIEELLDMGHRVGLHFDISKYQKNASIDELARSCSREREQLEKWFDVNIEIISFHSPLPKHLKMSTDATDGILHTYLPEYFERIFYCSDSTGQWRYGQPLESEAFMQKKPIHLLVHPIWWTSTVGDPQEILGEFLKEGSNSLKFELDATLSLMKPTSFYYR
ncbi:MAG: hypothetical protein P8L35_00280 [Acidimicrobiales bacterium]|nr:hypothetical protein [Acidimicrobiales bacterium]